MMAMLRLFVDSSSSLLFLSSSSMVSGGSYTKGLMPRSFKFGISGVGASGRTICFFFIVAASEEEDISGFNDVTKAAFFLSFFDSFCFIVSNFMASSRSLSSCSAYFLAARFAFADFPRFFDLLGFETDEASFVFFSLHPSSMSLSSSSSSISSSLEMFVSLLSASAAAALSGSKTSSSSPLPFNPPPFFFICLRCAAERRFFVPSKTSFCFVLPLPAASIEAFDSICVASSFTTFSPFTFVSSSSSSSFSSSSSSSSSSALLISRILRPRLSSPSSS
mmetsp:Transcript_106/g.378  ORF Transcript_106/g.378 Transcript_106/m.378 type:complete len:278 (+) Transcript_106:866-1699(+)